MAEVARRLHAAEVRRLEQLAQVHTVLAGGGTPADARRRTGLDRTVLANHFDNQGRLLIGRAADLSLQSRATEHVQRLAALPRALRPEDLERLSRVLRDHPGATEPRLREFARGAEVSRSAINHLFVAGTPLRDRVMTLPQEQHSVLIEAHTPAPEAAPVAARQPRARSQSSARTSTSTPTSTPTQTPTQAQAQAQAQAPARPPAIHPVHQRHLDEMRRFEQVATAHMRLVTGHGFEMAASEAGLPVELLASAFSPDGRLLLNAAGDGVAQTPDEATARRFAMLPRALEDADLAKLAELLHVLRHVPQPLLRQACVQGGVSPQAVAHLFDAGLPMRERLATLPEHQRTALEEALARVASPVAQSPRAASPAGVPAESAGGLPQDVRELLHRHLLSESEDSPLPSPPRSPDLPAFSDSDLAWLHQMLDEDAPQTDVVQPQPPSPVAASGGAGPSSASVPSGASVAAPAKASETPVLSQEVLEAVGRLLRQEGEHAAKYARAQAMLAGGASLAEAAKAIGAHKSTLGNSFSEKGHLLLTQAAERLLQARDPANAQPFAGLPRALTRSDLALMSKVLRENPDATDLQLHRAATEARVSRRAIAHLFGTGVPLRERLVTLPADQQRSLGITVPREVPQPALAPPAAAASGGSTTVPLAALPRPPSRPASPVGVAPALPDRLDLPFQEDDFAALLAHLETSPTRSPVRIPQPAEERGGTSPREPVAPGRAVGSVGETEASPVPTWSARAPRSLRQAGGLPDPGTPPWAQLDEPMSPTSKTLFDTTGSLAGAEHRPGPSASPRIPTDVVPPAESAAASRAAWAGTRQRTTQTRPRQTSLGESSSAAAPKRPGEELQAPPARRARREEAAPSSAEGLPGLRWGGHGPRTRPAVRAETPSSPEWSPSRSSGAE